MIQELGILNLALLAGDHNLNGGVVSFVSTTCCAWLAEACTLQVQHMDSKCYERELTCTRTTLYQGTNYCVCPVVYVEVCNVALLFTVWGSAGVWYSKLWSAKRV